MPVIKPGAFQLAVVDAKAERPHEVQPRAGHGAGARHISGILRDFRFDKYNIQNRHSILLCVFFHEGFPYNILREKGQDDEWVQSSESNLYH